MDVISIISDNEREEGEIEREDGEIVDDFEDISDISIPSCGKSDYSPDLLRAISLSSISDSDDAHEITNKQYYPPTKCHSKRKRKNKKKRRRHEIFSYDYRSRSDPSSSSSGEEKLDKRTLRQLKEAVRINASQKISHNSLRTRLKAMIDPDEEEEEDEDVDALRTIALLTNKNVEDKKDEEGEKKVQNDNENLDKEHESIDKELNELRLEALKSAMIKKANERKKRKMDEQNTQISINSNNKENTENNIIKDEEKKSEENNSIEDDVDVMRAMLLASMSTKIAANKPNITTSTPTVQRHVQKPPPTKTVITNIKVKPLIINLNSDSESDEKVATVNKPPVNTVIDQNVEEFLRKQREEFEAKQKEQDENLLDKSVVKLLSKSQQNEYLILKQKLLLASKKQRKVRRLSLKVQNNNPTTLKKTLQDMQIQKGGRLQMKGKYKELVPFIQKVNAASEKRRQCEERIKKLLGLLKEARTELASSHEKYTELVRHLSKAKDNIDTRLIKLTNAKKAVNAKKIIPPVPTSTDIVPLQNGSHQINSAESAMENSNNLPKENDTNYSTYVSPLDNRNSKTVTNNPLKMLCPYELFGVCKDEDCNFNHCP